MEIKLKGQEVFYGRFKTQQRGIFIKFVTGTEDDYPWPMGLVLTDKGSVDVVEATKITFPNLVKEQSNNLNATPIRSKHIIDWNYLPKTPCVGERCLVGVKHKSTGKRLRHVRIGSYGRGYVCHDENTYGWYIENTKDEVEPLEVYCWIYYLESPELLYTEA